MARESLQPERPSVHYANGGANARNSRDESLSAFVRPNLNLIYLGRPSTAPCLDYRARNTREVKPILTALRDVPTRG